MFIKNINLMKNIYITLIAVLLFSCANEDFNSDNGIPEYPKAEIETLREAPYTIGAAVNIAFLKSNIDYKNTLIKEMSSITTKNALTMNTVSVDRGQYNFNDVDYIVNFAQENNMYIHGHALIDHENIPNWVLAFNGSKEDWKKLMQEYIQDIVKRYKDKITSWDVVNEVIDDKGTLRSCIWLQNIGPEYIELAFRYAHEADPKAVLFYNEYGHEYSHVRRYAVNHLADSLAKKGVPIHGIGLQMHTNTNRLTTDLRYAITAAAVTGLKIHVSELDVSVNPNKQNITFSDELATAQQECYRIITKTMMDIPAEQRFGVTICGIHDASSWLSGNPDWPLLFNDDFERKPAYDGILQGIYQYD